MSTLRLLGLLVGSGIILSALIYIRGARWNRQYFFLSTVTGLALAFVCIFPNSVNFLRDLFSLGDFQFGRLLALAIIAIAFSIFLILYTLSKVNKLTYKMDSIICATVADNLRPEVKDQWPMKTIMIIIPALNEAESLKLLLPRIPRSIGGHEVGTLVIDDGSSDETSEVALSHHCWVARNPVNRGQGAASRVGYRVLKKHNVEIGITMDADNQHRPEDLPAMVQPILDNQCDLVIGSRILGTQESESLFRYVGIHLFSRIISFLVGYNLTDVSSGYKAFRMSRMAAVHLREDQFQASEVLIESAKKGLRIGEVPVHMNVRAYGMTRKGGNLTYGLSFFLTMIKSWLR